MADSPRRKRRRLDEELVGSARRRATVDSLQADGLWHFTTNIRAHHSCVNALAASFGDGRYLASAGDDLRVHLHDTFAADHSKPVATFTGPRWNVFALAFTAGSKLLSCGNERKISVYDLEGMCGGKACQGLYPVSEDDPSLDADLGVRSVRAHPNASQLVISTSTQSSICVFDLRAESAPVSRYWGRIHFSDAHFHPTQPHQILTADELGSVLLLDQRNLSVDKMLGAQAVVKVRSAQMASPWLS
jgi:WD repeat-containing protein 22